MLPNLETQEQRVAPAAHIGKGLRDDALNWSFAFGLTLLNPKLALLFWPIAAAREGVREFVRWKTKRLPGNYTDWTLPPSELQRLYQNEWPRSVEIRYKRRSWSIPQLLLADSSEGPLELKVHLRAGKFILSKSIQEITASYAGKLIEDLRKRDAFHVRLRDPVLSLNVMDVQRNGKKVDVYVRALDYQDVVATHYALDVDWMDNRQSLRQHLLAGNKYSMGDLKGSALPNVLGVDVLVFTPSGTLVLQKRSENVAIRRSEICASSSGGGSPGDVGRNCELSILREGAEEIALDPAKVVPNSIQFLGITRDFVSHGVVESYFCADTAETEQEIRDKADDAQDAREHSKIIFFHFGDELVRQPLDNEDSRDRFNAKMDELISKYRRKISVPLLAALSLWATHRLRR